MYKKLKNGKTNINPSKEAIILVFSFIVFIIIIFIIILLFSKIRIEINNFKFSSQAKSYINEDYKIKISLYLLNIIPILKINITRSKLEKIRLKEKVKDINFKIIKNKNKFDRKFFGVIKKIKVNIKKINLSIDIGTENAGLTAIITPIISTVIAIILKDKINNTKKQVFKINPIYINQNLINIMFSGIFDIRINHIITVIYNLNKKLGRSRKQSFIKRPKVQIT